MGVGGVGGGVHLLGPQAPPGDTGGCAPVHTTLNIRLLYRRWAASFSRQAYLVASVFQSLLAKKIASELTSFLRLVIYFLIKFLERDSLMRFLTLVLFAILCHPGPLSTGPASLLSCIHSVLNPPSLQISQKSLKEESKNVSKIVPLATSRGELKMGHPRFRWLPCCCYFVPLSLSPALPFLHYNCFIFSPPPPRPPPRQTSPPPRPKQPLSDKKIRSPPVIHMLSGFNYLLRVAQSKIMKAFNNTNRF